LTVPFRCAEEVVPLIEAGADELYCGVREAHAGIEYAPNAIVMSGGNFASFKELEGAVSLAASRNVPVLFVANSSQGRHTLRWQKRDIARAYGIGIRKITVTDFTLIPWLKSRFPDVYIVLSTLCPVFNAESLACFARMGINRIVLDGLFPLREIARLAEQTQRLGIDMEVFTTPQQCLLSRPNCAFHTWFMSAVLRTSSDPTYSSGVPCRQTLPVEVYEKRRASWACIGPSRCHPPPGSLDQNCVLCALWFLHQWGVPFIKNLGRFYPLEKKLLYLRLAKRYIRGLEDGTITSRDFVSKGRKTHKLILGRDCGGKRCFHPETRSLRSRAARLAKEYGHDR